LIFIILYGIIILGENDMEENNKIELSLYEMNRNIISQMAPINVSNKTSELREFLENSKNEYYMLYGKEISYFTLFLTKERKAIKVMEVLKECLENLGKVIVFEMTELEDAIEIWIRNSEDEITCLYFFPYDLGVERID